MQDALEGSGRMRENSKSDASRSAKRNKKGEWQKEEKGSEGRESLKGEG